MTEGKDMTDGFELMLELDRDGETSLPASARKEIDEVLVKHSKQTVSEIIANIDLWYGMRPTVITKPSDVRKMLKETSTKCQALRESLEASIGTTWTAIRAAAQDADGLDFQGWGFSKDDLKRDGWFYSPGHVVDELMRKIACLDALSTLAQERHIPKGGRLPSFEGRFWATQVASVCVKNNIKVTSYDDGEFFRLLEIVFRYAMPDSGETSYMRFGREMAREYSKSRDQK